MSNATSVQVQKLNAQLAEKLQRELHADEVLIWTGQPGRSGQTVGILFILTFGIVVTSFSAFFMLDTLGFPSAKHLPHSIIQWIFALFGLPFLLVGLSLIVMPLFLTRRIRKTVFAITNHRVIIGRYGGKVPSVYSLKPADLGNIKESCNSDGSGSIYFNLPDADADSGPIYNLSGQQVVPSGASGRPFQTDFLDIPAVHEVFNLLQKLARTESATVANNQQPDGDSSAPHT